jgi:hypothetical protein
MVIKASVIIIDMPMKNAQQTPIGKLLQLVIIIVIVNSNIAQGLVPTNHPNTAIPNEQKYQCIKTILKENADCGTPIVINDTVVFSINSPKGWGNELEVNDNSADDTLNFEREHNTLWYKFVAKANGYMTFDLIPVSQSDDYDFMLFCYNGSDFASKFKNKVITPIRTCISRNDNRLNSMTGLSLEETSKKHVHSGLGASYVKYVQVKKGDIFYLLIDNVNGNGNGHCLRFHHKTFAKDELYAGLLLPFKRITFMDSDYKFKEGNENTLDSIYNFLIANPNIRVEIQGHVNHTVGNIITKRVSSEYQLSVKRAEAIQKFLIEMGINPERLTCKGFGCSRMINPKAKTPKECYENARAEIYIASLDYKIKSE